MYMRRSSEFYNWFVMAAIALFVANNWWLKFEYHNWITGKLSDLLFCFFFPLYISAVLGFITNWSRDMRIYSGVVLTSVLFVSMKTSMTFSTYVSDIFSIFTEAVVGQSSINIVDSTDLIVLPVMICSVLVALKIRS